MSAMRNQSTYLSGRTGWSLHWSSSLSKCSLFMILFFSSGGIKFSIKRYLKYEIQVSVSRKHSIKATQTTFYAWKNGVNIKKNHPIIVSSFCPSNKLLGRVHPDWSHDNKMLSNATDLSLDHNNIHIYSRYSLKSQRHVKCVVCSFLITI